MPRRNRILLGLVTAALLVGPFAGSTLAIGTLDQSQTTLEGSLFSHWLGQTFTAGRSGALDTVSLYPTTDISGLTIEIRTASGGLPTATTLASQVIPASATNTWVDIAFTSPATVTAGTTYAIVLNANPDGATVLQGFGHYAAGDAVWSFDDVTWTVPTATADLVFRTYVTATSSGGVGVGAWRNDPVATTALLPQTLGSSYTVETFAQARTVFDNGNCGAHRPGDAIGCLAAQLLAAKLNVASGASDCIVPTITSAETFLSDTPYTGPATHYSLSRARRAEALSLQSALASYNGGAPCP